MRTPLLPLVFLALACPSHAAEEAPGTRWRCWYEGGESPAIACYLVPDAGKAAEQVPAPANLPPFVRRIRDEPASLADEKVLIPLHAPPLDMRFAERLARAVMCGGRAGCSVDFSEHPR